MKYCYRDATLWQMTEDPRKLRGADEAYCLGAKLTKAEIELANHQHEVEEAQREADRAQQRLDSAHARLRIEKLKAQP